MHNKTTDITEEIREESAVVIQDNKKELKERAKFGMAKIMHLVVVLAVTLTNAS